MPKRKIFKEPEHDPKKKKSTREAATKSAPTLARFGSSTTSTGSSNEELGRLSSVNQDLNAQWRLWGPYLSERQWGTVREDYSTDGNCWEHFSHDDAVFRAYRWGEDGLFGWSDIQARLCLGLALWNGKDPILKERLFGLTGPQGNHGEDVKECYYYLDSTPTHSYTRALYKYPNKAFPYSAILKENTQRGVDDDEYELLDTGVFNDGQYWDVYAEYSKESPTSILVQYTLHNRADQPAEIHVLPQVWFRNTWSWGPDEGNKPEIKLRQPGTVVCVHPELDEPYLFQAEKGPNNKFPEMLFTENETNQAKLNSTAKKGRTAYSKDAFHEYVINGKKSAVNPSHQGTKFAAYYKMTVPGRSSVTIRCRLLQDQKQTATNFDKSFAGIFNRRKTECEEFYNQILPSQLSDEEKNVTRQAYAGLCFTKQFFYYHVGEWAKGRDAPLNGEWKHMLNHDVVSMPDKWEFPWYATWDLAFHMVPFAQIDPEFAKSQLLLFLSERYMHPNGQLPAYEFNFSDVNPPVHAWACLQVYKTRIVDSPLDVTFLKRCFHKLLLNFNWWVNKKDRHGRHIYHGGFLGMDNISCVHRSDLPKDTSLDQVDGTSWMAFYSICMLKMALELAHSDPSYEDMAIKFLEHFFFINDAINGREHGLWDEVDGFYYDRLTDDKDKTHILRIRSLVGLSSMFASYVLDISNFKELPAFHHKLKELFHNRRDLMTRFDKKNGDRILLSIPNKSQIERMIQYVVNDEEFLSPYGIRALSKYHKDHPVCVELDGTVHSVSYCPGESNSDMFGGNSNWRGPIWICMNYLLLEALDIYGEFYDDQLTVEMPQGSGRHVQLQDLASNIRKRLASVFLPDNTGKRPLHGSQSVYGRDSSWQDLVLFYEYFNADTGQGCGASHQTGWTALIANIVTKIAESRH